MLWRVAGVALGCGGTVCDGGTTYGSTSTGGGPIVQSGERIVFLQDQDDAWTALVQIQTQGAPEAFGWVVPVPNPVDPADVTIAPDGLMDDLEQATAPQFQTDAGTSSGASTGTSSSSSSSCSSGCSGVPSLGDLVELGAGQLLGSAVVGPYEISSVGPDDMDALAAWFAEGGYNLPITTWPIIDDYVADGFSFVIVRLNPLQGGGQGTVQTLRIPCGQAAPAIPLTLTSIAAVSDMVITSYVVANQRYEPANDWPEVTFDPQTVNPSNPTTDYVAQVQAALDAGGGRGFRTEFAGPITSLSLSPDTLDALGTGPYVTRLQTWVSPTDMVSDPEFVASETTEDLSNVIDLRTRGAAGVGLFAPALLGVVGIWRRRQAR
jgi:hypothetical protein